MQATQEMRSRARTEVVVPVAVGIATGLVAMILGGLEMKWIVYIFGAGLAAFVIPMVSVRTWALSLFVLTLQLDTHYWLGALRPPSYVGMSSPEVFSIALVSIPALFFLFLEAYRSTYPVSFLVRAVQSLGLPVAFLFAAMWISTINSEVSRFGYTTLFQHAQFALVFMVAANCLRTREDLSYALKLLISILLTQSLVSFFQIAMGESFSAVGTVTGVAGAQGLLRAGGTVSQGPAGFTIFLEPILFMTVVGLLTTESGGLRRLYGLLVFMGTAACLLTLSRTTIVALPLGVVVCLLLLQKDGYSVARAWRGIGVLVVAGLIGTLIAYPALSARVASQDLSADYDTRFELMRIALAMIRDHPIIGVGPGGYPYAMAPYVPTGIWVYVVHNEYLMRWVDMGTVGIVAWFTWYISGLRITWRCTRLSDHHVSLMATGLFAGLIVRLWDLMWWSNHPFPAQCLPWLIFGMMTAAAKIETGENPEAGASVSATVGAGGIRPRPGT